jgi:histidine ammonia-lyase
LELDGHGLSPEIVAAVARHGGKLTISSRAFERMISARAVVERALEGDKPIYGLTTGVGPSVSHSLGSDTIADFSRLIVHGRSNAVGAPLSKAVVRAVMLVRLNALLNGGAGVSPEVATLICALLNSGLTPVMPSIGSVGASDLCIMAHLGAALMGEGDMLVDDRVQAAARALHDAGLRPLRLAPKDGLAICSSSAVTAGTAALSLVDSRDILELFNAAAALSMEGLRANLSPFEPRVVASRPAPGQVDVSARLRQLLEGGELGSPGVARRVQDPLSFRCIGSVHGSLAAAIGFLEPAVAAELNASPDNPLVLIGEGRLVSTGNFHTPALAIALEALAQSLAHVSALSVRRCAVLLSATLSGLPSRLTRRGPSRAGFAPLLKTADALQTEIRHLANPAPMELHYDSEGVEDDIPNTHFRAKKVGLQLEYLRRVLAIELIIGSQAAELATFEQMGRGPERTLALVREVVAAMDEDRALSADVEGLVVQLLESGRLLSSLQAVV